MGRSLAVGRGSARAVGLGLMVGDWVGTTDVDELVDAAFVGVACGVIALSAGDAVFSTNVASVVGVEFPVESAVSPVHAATIDKTTMAIA